MSLFNLTAASDDILLPALLDGDQPLLEAQLQDSKAWLIGSSDSAPPAASLNEALAKQGFDANNLDGLQVWSHLTGDDRQGQLQATVAGATGVAQSNRWWATASMACAINCKAMAQAEYPASCWSASIPPVGPLPCWRPMAAVPLMCSNPGPCGAACNCSPANASVHRSKGRPWRYHRIKAALSSTRC